MNQEVKPIIKDLEKIESFLAGDQTQISEVLHPKNDNIKIPYSIAYGYLEAKESSIDHSLQNEEVYVFISGEGEIVIDGSTFTVKEKQLVLVPKNARQFVRNNGDKRLVFLCIVSPAWTEDKEEIF